MSRIPFILLAGALALTGAVASAATLRVAAPSTVTLRGQTNVHPWRCQSTLVQGSLESAASWSVIETALTAATGGSPGAAIAALPAGVTLPQPTFTAGIPVRSFNCGNRLMENDLRKALKADSAPEIRFQYRDLARVTSERAAKDALASWYLSVEMEIRLAGASRRIPMVLRVDRLTRNTFRVAGSTDLRMTDFGITPPTGMFGMIRAADELEVDVSLLLEVR